MKKKLLFSLFVSMLLCNPSGAQNAFSKKEFDRIQTELKFDPDATWRSIPWQTSLLKAQAIAAKDRKTHLSLGDEWQPIGLYVNQRIDRPCAVL